MSVFNRDEARAAAIGRRVTFAEIKAQVLPTQFVVTDESPRCWSCGRKLAERATRPWTIRCRCKEVNGVQYDN
jgi:hypothetical protein